MKRWNAIILTVAMLMCMAGFAEDLEMDEEVIIEYEDIPVDEVDIHVVDELKDFALDDIDELCLSDLLDESIETDEVDEETAEAMVTNAANIAIDETHFPDEYFRTHIIAAFDTNSDNYLSSEEIAAVYEISASEGISLTHISSVRGIEYFSALKKLNCFHLDGLTQLDVSKNKQLNWLYCRLNELTGLNVSNNTELNWLDCGMNEITELDLRNNAALEYCQCDGNKLTSIQLGNNSRLRHFSAIDNPLVKLDISGCSELVKAVKYGTMEKKSGYRDWSSRTGYYEYRIYKYQSITLYIPSDTEVTVEQTTDPGLTFPIVIGNNHGTAGTFNESLDQYILNMDSGKYYYDLSYMLMSLAAAAYNDTGSQSGQLTVENAGYQSASGELYYITKAFKDLGFADYQPFNYYNNPNDSSYGSDNAAFTIGRKQISENEALVLIVIRGSYGDLSKMTSDWRSNARIDIDSSGRHYGFATAADKVYSQAMSFLKSRYSNAFIKSNIRYVITGHSRGAAAANLLAVKLHDAGIPNSKVYDYNFACPDTVRGFTLGDLKKGHENIFNICNSADAVSVIPGVIGDGLAGIIAKFQNLFVSWGKYGKTYFYCKNWNSTKEFDLTRTFDEHYSPHDYKFYVADMSKKPGGFKTWAQIVKRRIKLGVADGISSIISTFYPSYGVTSIEKAKTTIEDQVYTGKALKPTVKVVLNKKTLKKGTDYTVAYSNNKKIGTATVTINGKGKYTGTKSVSFKILPNAVTGLKLTAGKRQMTVSWKKVSGVTGYQLQYYPKGNSASVKKVIISSSKTVKKTIKSLKKGRVYYVRIRSYKKVNGSNYYSVWSTKKKVTIK